MQRLGNALAPLAAVVFAVVYIGITIDLPRESRIFPHTAAAMVLLFGTVLLVQELLVATAPERTPGEVAVRSKAPLVFGLSVAFVAGFWSIGFFAASSLYLFVSQVLLKERWVRAAAIAVGVTGVLYLLFARLLGVQL